MGTQSMHDLTGTRENDLEIVGLNGAPRVECGRALAVARCRSDGLHCVLRSPGERAIPSWYDEDEAAAFAEAGRWTRLRKPLPLPGSCVDGSDGRVTRQPMMVFAADSFLEAVGRKTRPATADGEALVWTGLERYDDSYRAASSSAQSVETLLDDWAKSLKERYDAMYREAGRSEVTQESGGLHALLRKESVPAPAGVRALCHGARPRAGAAGVRRVHQERVS